MTCAAWRVGTEQFPLGPKRAWNDPVSVANGTKEDTKGPERWKGLEQIRAEPPQTPPRHPASARPFLHGLAEQLPSKDVRYRRSTSRPANMN